MSNSRKRNPIAGRWVALFLVFMFILPLSSMVQGASSSDTATKGPLIAYKARAIPRIDGVLSPSEWDDAKPYSYCGVFTHEGRPVYANAICLKHDAHTLYLLCTVEDDKYNGGDKLIIYLPPQGHEMSYYGGFWWNVVYIHGDGRVFDGVKEGKKTPPSDSTIKSAVSYVNKIYTFEVAMDMKYYFNSTDGNLSFDIAYRDEDLMERLGDLCPRTQFYIRFCDSYSPGILLSSDYYNGTQHMYDVVWNLYEPSEISLEQGFLYLVGITVAVTSAIIGVIVWKSRKKK